MADGPPARGMKRDKANSLLTQIANALGLTEQALVINCLGIRAAESPARSRNFGQCCVVRTTRVRSAGLACVDAVRFTHEGG
nr:hypothetical protein OG781_04420 [Streptomyces sp. NBC_00830]